MTVFFYVLFFFVFLEVSISKCLGGFGEKRGGELPHSESNKPDDRNRMKCPRNGEQRVHIK